MSAWLHGAGDECGIGVRSGLGILQDPAPASGKRQSATFLALYGLAVAGGSSSYGPFLTILLPARLIELFGESAVLVMSYTAFAGAIAASLSNIMFGWASDRTGHRRGWILAGLVLSCLLLVSMRAADTVPRLVGMVVAWQVALNMMLGPLAAWAGDCVPNEQKGLLGGLLSLAPGVGALVGATITLPFVAAGEWRLVLNAAFVAVLVLPVLLFGRPRPMPHLKAHLLEPDHSIIEIASTASSPIPVWRMWLARLLVQVSEASLFAFLLIWLARLDPTIGENDVATVFTVVLFAAVPAAIVAGSWSDRTNRPLAPLAVCAATATFGLAGMALAPNIGWGIGSYLTFGIGASIFLALHSSQTLRVLPRPEHRGRDLGIFNLTNTIPSLVMPGFALALIPVFGFRALFAALAGLTFLAVPLLIPRGARR